MASNDILAEFNASKISSFKKDFTQMIKLGAEIDRHYGKGHHGLGILMPKFEKLVEQFNKKYKGVKLRARRTIDEFMVRLFVNEKNIKEFFADSASRIPGLKSVGITKFNQVDISDSEQFAKFLDTLIDKIYISYLDPESGTSSVEGIADRSRRMIELIYNPSEVINDNSAGFKICAFYALKQGFDSKIDIYAEASTLGFANLLDEVEKREWYDKFNSSF